MQIERFAPLPAYLLERLLPFDSPHNGQSWELLYRSLSALQQAHPEERFTSAPRLHVDIRGQSCGLIFIAADSGELFYVHD
ncbi:MAG: hypothetical protein CMI01_15025 [Oceanospirillaceae bacterium]|jgi:hypothetical protein|uniref:hypothetical protein n=1 Tax=Marinobacterium litorale TaxID=404770 RepID=UPI0004221D7E|nr:hypothetical protein [Marinobacterium litorale]MBS99972.1 hypothetical protein [Oceanospirillaceae bacterium]